MPGTAFDLLLAGDGFLHSAAMTATSPKRLNRFCQSSQLLRFAIRLKEKFAEGVIRWLAGEAIINVLVILVCFELQFVRIAKEQQAEEQKGADKSKRG